MSNPFDAAIRALEGISSNLPDGCTAVKQDRAAIRLLEAAGDLHIEADPDQRVLTIEGVRYAYEIFREWGNNGIPVGTAFRLIYRDNGTVAIKRLSALPEKVSHD